MRYTIFLLMILCFANQARSAVHTSLSGGWSFQSSYQYFASEPSTQSADWITFDPIHSPIGMVGLSVDVWEDKFRLGVMGGLHRRFELTQHRRSPDPDSTYDRTIGSVLSIPLMICIENHSNGPFYGFGLGPTITRFNYTRADLPPFEVTSLFSFLFSGGYEFAVTKELAVYGRGDLLIGAPIFLADELDTILKEEIGPSRYTPYNVNEFQTVIFNGIISIGVSYAFGGDEVGIAGEKLWSRLVEVVSPKK